MAEKQKKTKRPTAEKRMIQSEKRRVQNREFKSRVRTAIRRFEESLKSADKAQIESTLSAVYGLLDRAVKNNVFKLNKSSRLKSRLTARAHATA